MTLNPHASFPNARAYVLKLHRDARSGHVFGRLESLWSGQRFEFRSGEELLARLSQDLAPSEATQETADHSTEGAGGGTV